MHVHRRWVNVEVVCSFTVVEVLGQHAVFDQNFLSRIDAFVVNGYARSRPSWWVVNHVTSSFPIFCPSFPSRQESPAATKSASQGWPKAS